jgi:carboxypeptidase Q
MMRRIAALALLAALNTSVAVAQRGGGRGGGPPQTPPLSAEELARLRAQLLQVLQAQPAPAPQPYVRTGPPTDPVILKMWEEGWTNGQAGKLIQVLADSVGSRLTGSPGAEKASAWVMKMYDSWGISARKHQYGTWNSYRRGVTHIDLIEPRVRTLEGMMLSWSPGTGGRALEGAAVTLSKDTTAAGLNRWLPSVRGKWVLTGAPRISCRMPAQWQEFGLPESRDAMNAQQTALNNDVAARVRAVAGAGPGGGAATARLQTRLKEAGALGVMASNWSNYPGIDKIFGSPSQVLPTFDLSCEDYGLVFRLAENNQGPRLRINADAEFLGEKPVWNTIAEMKGSSKPNEYIILSAHFDSWEGHSGLTDNGTGTMVMMEAMRILKATYPNPKRTILVGHWMGEEQGLNGSRAFVEDNPQIVAGVVAGFNQDNGTGRVQSVGPGPFIGMDGVVKQYLSALPSQITRHINVGNPSSGPGTGGSDHASWQCAKAPVMSLGALSWDYSNTTWHTNRDSYDKVVVDDLKNNATLVAMLAYMASEDPQTVPKYFPQVRNQQGELTAWPDCAKSTRNSQASNR